MATKKPPKASVDIEKELSDMSSGWSRNEGTAAFTGFGDRNPFAAPASYTKDGRTMSQQEYDAMLNQKREEIRVAKMAEQGLNPDGSPMRPEYESLLDPTTGLMKDIYKYNPKQLDPTTLEGYQAVKKRVMTEGPSAWATQMLEKQKFEEAQQKDAAARQAMSSAAQARGQLAMRGGMSSGARERLAQGGGRDLLMARQGAASEGIKGRLGINIEDEAQRMKLLPEFANAESKIAESNLALGNKAQEWNILRSLEEKRAKDAQELAVYQEQIKKWGSEREAEATKNSGGGGGK